MCLASKRCWPDVLGGPPPADQLASLAHSLQQSCVAFCTSCHALTAAAGPTLRAALLKLAQEVVRPCLTLVKEMASGRDLKPQVAVVWDGVAAVPKAPLDNKSCLFKALAGVMAVMKDTTREVGMPSRYASNGRVEQEQQEQFGDAEPAAALQQQTTAAVLKQQQQQAAVYRQTPAASGEVLAGSEVLDAWESCLFHSRHLKRAVEDLGAALYPPQDFEEVASAALAVFEVTELMADECPNADAVGAQQLSSLAAQLTAAHERMQELLGQAQQEANNEGEEEQ
ncbi:Grap2 and cyclin-D-interacting-domain-containing protein [Scenedesmus sp. NREL 46B-D3]|nr:Grap2 and cyclin-D-interacting-domain-containing protein [Scenedesmus sp. NREL 46B-D3]